MVDMVGEGGDDVAAGRLDLGRIIHPVPPFRGFGAVLAPEARAFRRGRGFFPGFRVPGRIASRLRDAAAPGNPRGVPSRAMRHADRKSTRLNPVTNAHIVCRLLLEKKKKTHKIYTQYNE